MANLAASFAPAPPNLKMRPAMRAASASAPTITKPISVGTEPARRLQAERSAAASGHGGGRQPAIRRPAPESARPGVGGDYLRPRLIELSRRGPWIGASAAGASEAVAVVPGAADGAWSRGTRSVTDIRGTPSAARSRWMAGAAFSVVAMPVAGERRDAAGFPFRAEYQHCVWPRDRRDSTSGCLWALRLSGRTDNCRRRAPLRSSQRRT